MATEEEAHEARLRHAEYLRGLGAHAIGVDKLEVHGKKTFGVIAYYERPPAEGPPESLEIERAGKKVTVPLIATISPRISIK